MKRIALSLLLLSSVSLVLGQAEKAVNKKVADSFEIYFNSDNYDAIFNSFAPVMQNALPLDKTREFVKSVKAQAGNITKRQFIKYEQSYASYKTNFERALLSLSISVDDNSKINGMFIKPYKEANLPKLSRNVTKLSLPFKGEWSIVWGGDTKELNYHVESEAQKNAFDIVVKNEKGVSFRTDGGKNEDYYAFGMDIIAPCEGEVVLVVDGVKDNVPGVLNPVYVPGNSVIIKTKNGEYLFFAHFKQHSIVVKQGQIVKTGDLLGLCGNSGNSSEPHLHFHIQNVEDLNVATGVKCYFDSIMVNGQLKTDYSPIQKDKISNVKQ